MDMHMSEFSSYHWLSGKMVKSNLQNTYWKAIYNKIEFLMKVMSY